MSALRGLLQRQCACGGSPGAGGECAECQKKRLDLQRKEAGGGRPATAPPIVHEVLGSPGRPMELATRSLMEDRFGHDFGRVRVHADGKAAESARAVNAVAYTVGNDIIFGAGRYAPASWAGRRLLAHELTHVVQQKQMSQQTTEALTVNDPSDLAEREADQITDAVMAKRRPTSTHSVPESFSLQRACGPATIGTPSGCDLRPPVFVPGPSFKFRSECDDFDPSSEQTALVAMSSGAAPGAAFEIHGFASVDGPADFNRDLSCARALKAKLVMTTMGGISSTRITDVFRHGPTPGPATDRRSVTIVTTAAVPPPPKCGPDATDWFVLQVNTATVDPAVLAVQSDLAAADALARRHGVSAATVSEGGAATAVFGQEILLGSRAPARNPTISAQLTAGAISGAAALALTPTGAFDRRKIDTPRILFFIGRAALQWKVLVDHAARYDFKAHTDSMNHPGSANCPQDDCPPGEVGIVTLCPGINPESCYESDLPGNLFYALIGRHVGWSELTLQLGSQLAELTDATPRPARPAITWDTPNDTAAISLGFSLPLPLTRTALCSALAPARGRLATRTGCDDCLDPTPARIR